LDIKSLFYINAQLLGPHRLPHLTISSVQHGSAGCNVKVAMLKRITSLAFSMIPSEVTYYNIANALASMANLTRLDFSHCRYLNNAGLFCLGALCRQKGLCNNLTELNMSSCICNDEFVLSFLTACPSLKSLNLSNNSWVSDKLVNTLASSTSNIEVLDLSCCHLVGEEELILFLEKQCVASKGFKLRNNRKLRVLHLSDCMRLCQEKALFRYFNASLGENLVSHIQWCHCSKGIVRCMMYI